MTTTRRRGPSTGRPGEGRQHKVWLTEAEAAGERPATTAHRGLLAWLYLYEATAAVERMNTIVTTAVCSRWDESMICGQPSAWDPEPVYFVHKGHGHRHQE